MVRRGRVPRSRVLSRIERAKQWSTPTPVPEYQGPEAIAAAMSEAELQGMIEAILTQLGYWWFHDVDARKNNPGHPDLVAMKMMATGVVRLIYAELKTERGRLRPDQKLTLALLTRVPGVEVYLWRPRDLPQIMDILMNGAGAQYQPPAEDLPPLPFAPSPPYPPPPIPLPLETDANESHLI